MCLYWVDEEWWGYQGCKAMRMGSGGRVLEKKKITSQHTLIPFQGLPFAETTCLVPILEAWIVQLAAKFPNLAFLWVRVDY